MTLPMTSRPHYEVWGIYSLISLFRIPASSTPLSWSLGMNFVVIIDPSVVCMYDYPGWANVMELSLIHI